MTIREGRIIERRLIGWGTGLVLAGSAVAWILFGPKSGASFLLGGLVGALNWIWLARAVGAFLKDPKHSKHRVLAGYLARLLLIPLVLYAIMWFHFLSLPAAVAGLAVFNCSVFIEGVLEAWEGSSQ